MRVVVLGCNGAGLRSHYITGYHGPVVSGWMSFIFFLIGTISYAIV